MQQVSLKSGSMAEARYGNNDAYYLRSIEGDYALLECRTPDELPKSLCVAVIEIEAVEPDVKLPVSISDDDILEMFINANGIFAGIFVRGDQNVHLYNIDEESIIKFIRSLL